jgi:hypothetical protein
MSNKYSAPDCRVCVEYADGLACGRCTERVTGVEHRGREAKKKRRVAIATAVANALFRYERAAVGPRADITTQRAWLRCLNGHSWQSAMLPETDEAVEQPQCPVCDAFFNRVHFVDATYDESVVCADACRRANEWRCICSCGGANHGIGKGALTTTS